MIHSGKNKQSPFEILDIIEAAGGDVSHTAIGHLDRTLFNNDDVLKLAKRGCYLEYDLFGSECSHYQVCRLTTLQVCYNQLTTIEITHR